MSIVARIDQEVTFSPVFKDAAGNAVTEFGSVPAWSLSDESLATLAVSEDGLMAIVTSTGNIGDVEVNMVIDADPDADVEEIVGKAMISFKAGKVAFISLTGSVSDIETFVTDPAPVEQTPVTTTTVAPEAVVEQPAGEANSEAPAVVEDTAGAPVEGEQAAQAEADATAEQPKAE